MAERTGTDAGVVLAACPFCRGSNVKTFGPYGWYRKWGISHSCASFYSGAQEMFQGFNSEAEAIAAWNRRTPPPPAPAQMEAVVEALRGQGEALVEQLVQAVYEDWPHKAISPALVELTGVPLGEVIPYEKVIAAGGDMVFNRRAVRAVLAALSTLPASPAGEGK